MRRRAKYGPITGPVFQARSAVQADTWRRPKAALDGASALTETVDGRRPRREDRRGSTASGLSAVRRSRSDVLRESRRVGRRNTTAGAGRNSGRGAIAVSRDFGISPETHLGGTALDNHETALANGTGLHGDGGGRAGIGGLELLDIGMIRHGWMLRWASGVCRALQKKSERGLCRGTFSAVRSPVLRCSPCSCLAVCFGDSRKPRRKSNEVCCAQYCSFMNPVSLVRFC